MGSNSEKPENALDVLYGSLKNIRIGIDRELAKGQNGWVHCFGSRLFQVETLLSISTVRSQFSGSDYKLIEERLGRLNEEFGVMKEQYGDILPSEEEREELIVKLENILKN